MKRALSSFLISIVFLFSFSICAGATDYQSTVMTGQGTTKDEAIQDAIRNAVESATGVFVYSASEVKDFKLVKDQIVTASKGYVKDYKLLSESKGEGIVFVTLNVSVDTATIKSVIKRDMRTTTYEDALKDYASVASLVERNKKYAEILKSISSRSLNELYNVSFSGYEIVSAGTTSADVILKFNIAPNNFLWDTYYETLRLIGSNQGNYRLDNHVIIKYSIVKERQSGLDIAGERIYFHNDFNNYIINPRYVAVVYGLPDGDFHLKPFMIYDRYIDKSDYYGRNVIPIHLNQVVSRKVSQNTVGFFMGNEGYVFKVRHTLKNIDDIKKLPSIKVFLKDVAQKNITYKWN